MMQGEDSYDYSGSDGELRIYFTEFSRLNQNYINGLIGMDGAKAMFAMLFSYIYIIFHTHDFGLSTVGMIHIIVSMPVSHNAVRFLWFNASHHCGTGRRSVSPCISALSGMTASTLSALWESLSSSALVRASALDSVYYHHILCLLTRKGVRRRQYFYCRGLLEAVVAFFRSRGPARTHGLDLDTLCPCDAHHHAHHRSRLYGECLVANTSHCCIWRLFGAARSHQLPLCHNLVRLRALTRRSYYSTIAG